MAALAVSVTGIDELLGILGNLKRSGEAAAAMQATIGSSLGYAGFVEYGTAPHVIVPVNARALRFQAGGATVFAKRVNHPGTKPNPFIEQALVESEASIVRLVDDALGTVAVGGPVSSVAAAVHNAAELVRVTAMAKAPVKTGALRDSISAVIAGV